MHRQKTPNKCHRPLAIGLIAALAIGALDIAPASADTVKPSNKPPNQSQITAATETVELSAHKRRYRRGDRRALRTFLATAGLIAAIAAERRRHRHWRRHHYYRHYDYPPPNYYYYRPYRRHRQYHFYFRY